MKNMVTIWLFSIVFGFQSPIFRVESSKKEAQGAGLKVNDLITLNH